MRRLVCMYVHKAGVLEKREREMWDPEAGSLVSATSTRKELYSVRPRPEKETREKGKRTIGRGFDRTRAPTISIIHLPIRISLKFISH